MNNLTDLFKIDGQNMYAPDGDVSVSYEDLESADSGRDEGGAMHRIVIRQNAGTWSFSYTGITEAEKQYMEGLFDGKTEFDFTHPDRVDATKQIVSRAYRSGYNLSWKNARTGLWSGYSFDIVEC